ncbi:MAG TPA: substrate-binding domain-containing protein [Pseudonocardiaceae bacterium]|nr:substrate-binding domain-containing protein [Pseudonocardiaceae bacterium]
MQPERVGEVGVSGVPRRPVTLEVVAEHAGVSRQTVSNALNAPGKLRPETLRRVQASIAALGYRPDRHARSLRTRAAGALGYGLPPDGTGGLADRFLPALCRATAASGRELLLFTAPAGREGLPAYEELLAHGVVDGFVLSHVEPGDVRHTWLAWRGIRFTSVGRIWTAEQPGPWVDTDHAAGTDAAVHHLHGRGHRRIALLGHPAGPGASEDRVTGWRRACRALGLPNSDDLIARIPERTADLADRIAAGRSGTTRLLDIAPRPTAVVAVSDDLALGALHAIAERGLRAGPDVAVTGVGDSAVCAAVRPALTTVRLPVEEMARRAIGLLDGIAIPFLGGCPGLLLGPQLIVRDSTPPPDAESSVRAG